MAKNRYLIKLFAAVLILVPAVNAAVLHFGFGIRISDLVSFIAETVGDSSAEKWFGEGDGSSQKGDSSAKKRIEKGDGPSEMQAGEEDSPSGKEHISKTGDGSPENGIGIGSSSESPNDGFVRQVDVPVVMKKLSLGDKIFLYGILTRISSDELEKMLEMAQDGISADEMEEIKGYADGSLKSSEIARLEEMVARYRHLYAEAGK